MKRVYVNEEWCLGCRLCEYNCAFANSGLGDMVLALKDRKIFPRIHVEGNDSITFAVSCRHCTDPICQKSCIAGAISKADGVVRIDRSKCVGCLTCVLVCPYGALSPGEDGIMQKCELCLENACGAPACVTGCPNKAIVYEERSDPE
ncbi:MAG: 4Fe-4S binding protein [Clostridia bacterium]|nr:4Fe-4S binding protein [Clostridia bacterium]